MDGQVFLEHLDSFESICDFIEQRSPEEILGIVSTLLSKEPDELAKMRTGSFSREANDDGSLSQEYGYINALLDLTKFLDDYKYVYSLLNDDRSRKVFVNIMRFRLAPMSYFIAESYKLSAMYPQYFAQDIYTLDKNEVFVDCGGYIGDTTEEFIRNCPNFKKIYIYDPLNENCNICLKKFADYDNIVIRQAGVGRSSDKMTFFAGPDDSSGSFLTLSNQNLGEAGTFNVVSLDEDIPEPVTFIKMDIEGFELDAIRGAVEHIKNEKPILAVSVYHMITDLREIPKQIYEINPDYKFYLRHYREDQYWETVLYAIPKNK